MPTYSYACTECDNRFDIVQAFTDESLTVCPRCTGRLRKLFSSVGIVFKGSGFYRNDSRSASTSAEGAGGSAGDKAGGEKSGGDTADKAGKTGGDKSGGDKVGKSGGDGTSSTGGGSGSASASRGSSGGPSSPSPARPAASS